MDVIEHIARVRGALFFEQIWNRDKDKPYYEGKVHNDAAYHEFLEDYHRLGLTLYKHTPCEKLMIDVTEEHWTEYEDRLLAFAGLRRMPDILTELAPGVFVNATLGQSLTVYFEDEQPFLIDGNGNHERLYARNQTEFYLADSSVILRFENQDTIVVVGGQLNHRWTDVGTEFVRVKPQNVPMR